MTPRPLRLALLASTLLAAAAFAGTPEGRLKELGLALPAANAPVANYVPATVDITLHSENGMLGVGPYPREESATGVCFMDGAVRELWSPAGLSKPVNRAIRYKAARNSRSVSRT